MADKTSKIFTVWSYLRVSCLCTTVFFVSVWLIHLTISPALTTNKLHLQIKRSIFHLVPKDLNPKKQQQQ